MQQRISNSANKKILFLPHAMKQMSHPDRMTTADEIRDAVLFGEVKEEYQNDQRGESCLILHTKKSRIIHVVCAPKTEYLAIITAYIPALDQWSSNFKIRR